MARGSIRRRGQSWQLRVYVGVAPDGRRRYVSKTVKGSKREAEAALTELQGQANAGAYTGPATPPSPTSSSTGTRWRRPAGRPRLPTTTGW